MSYLHDMLRQIQSAEPEPTAEPQYCALLSSDELDDVDDTAMIYHSGSEQRTLM